MAQKIIGEDGEIYAYKNKKPFYKKWWFIALIVTALIIVMIVKFGGQVIAIYLLMFLLLAMIIQGIRTLFVILQKDDKNIQKNAKIFAVIFGFALFLVYSIIATTPEKDKVVNNKMEVKKVETKKEEPKVETKTTTSKVDKSITTKEQKRLVMFLENSDNRYFDNFKEILTAFDNQDFDKTKTLLNRYKGKLKEIYNNVLDYECKPTGNPIFDKECGELSQAASEDYTFKNNTINEIEYFFNNPSEATLENVRTEFRYVLEKSNELRDKYAIFKNKNF